MKILFNPLVCLQKLTTCFNLTCCCGERDYVI